MNTQLINRINIVIWFLKRPRLYKQLIRELIKYAKRKEHPTLSISKEAINWCENRSIDEESAILKIDPTWKFHDYEKEFSNLVCEGFETIKKFDFNWGGQGNLSLNYSIAKNIDAKNIIETGVAYGWSSLAILTHLDLSKIGTLTSIDMPFWGTQDEDKIGCVIPKRFFKYWKLIRLPDRDAVPKVVKKDANFDLCHYDSDKSYGGKKWALPKLWKAIRNGGILVCDDVSDNLAFKDFCEERMINPIIVKTFDSQVIKYVGIAIKSKI